MMVSFRRQDPMKNITIALPENYINNLKKIQRFGLIANRSEGIRVAVREFLKKEVYNSEVLGYELQ